MTSVTEAFAVSPRPAKSERAPKPGGGQGEESFARLMDEETRPEAPRKAKTSDTPKTREAEKPADNEAQTASSVQDGTASGNGSVQDESNRTDPAEPGMQQAAAIVTIAATVTAVTPEPATPADTDLEVASPDPAIVPPAVPTIEPSAAPIAVSPPVQSTTEADAPQTEMTATPAAPTPPGRGGGLATGLAARSGTGSKPALAGHAAAKPATETSDESHLDAQATDADPTMQPEATDTESTAPQGETRAEAESETVRPASPANKPETKPDATAKPADPALDIKSPEPSAQLAHTAHVAGPSPAHATTAHATTPQPAALGAAQAVPVNAIAIEIAGQARAGNSRFEIRLDPPELGRIDVRLDIDRDGNVSSRLVIDRADTYDLLRRDQSTLERALQQAGLKTSGESLEFSLRDQGFAQQHRSAEDLPRGNHAMVQDNEVPPAEAAQGYARLIGARGGIDIRV